MNQVQMPRMNKARQDRIVAAAREIAAKEGWSAVTVRRIASLIGCSAPAIYQYFRDKDAVLAAMADEAESYLYGLLQAAVADVGGPAKRLRALARGQWEFAFDRPELYALLHGGEGLRRVHRSPAADKVTGLWRSAADDLAGKRDIGGKPEDVADQALALVHGFIALTIAGALGDQDRALRLMTEAFDALLRGLEKK